MPVAATHIIMASQTTMTAMADRTQTYGAARLSGGVPPERAPSAPAPAEAAPTSAELLVWLSPSFPVGSFAFSHGIEWAAHAGDVRDAATTIEWIGALITHGALRNDAILAACAWRAAHEQNAPALREANQLALALAGSRERLLETTAQGNAFVTTIRAAWSSPEIERVLGYLHGDIAYPVAVGAAAAGQDIPLVDTLDLFTVAILQNLVSATIRLSAIGQTDGQRVIAALLPAARTLASQCRDATLDDVGGAAFGSDLAALKHETQYTRLFRS